VVHCTSKNSPRAFCAPFLLQDVADGDDTPPSWSLKNQTGNFINNATVALSSKHGSIQLKSTGHYFVNITATFASSCTSTVSYAVFNDSSCKFAYDPTTQCLPLSQYDGTKCSSDKACGAATYDCEFSSSAYSCSPSDLSGKYGKTGTNKLLVTEGWDDLMIPLLQLRNKYLGLYCSDSLTVVECQPWQLGDQTTKSPTNTPTTRQPTHQPTHLPHKHPTARPSMAPTTAPTNAPVVAPTNSPTVSPTDIPTMPTAVPSMQPIPSPTSQPTAPTAGKAKSVSRAIVGVGMWLALLNLLWI